ncbi:MAG: hypothetical protein DRP62_08730 [Planctomycetota bacterium]|nr:MAG: hypothetical protein DRP62_08730 [Planctomycetota bacterium]
MVKFSNDVDILKYEPALFGELHLPWQVLAAGTSGELSGTGFTDSEADFVSAQVSAEGVIYLQTSDGSLDGAFEIVSVDSATQLTVSVIRTDPNEEPVAPPAAANISYRISTLEPQAGEAGFQLTEYFGIKPGNPASNIDAEDVLDTNALKRASAFAVISSVYAMLASKDDNENFWQKSHHYQKLFEKARERCRVSIDSGSDGVADITIAGASARLVRD